jgi:triacylglycerol lipase
MAVSMALPELKPFPANLTLQQQIDLVAHPETNPTGYAPFAHAADYPFRPEATLWSRVNAWWLAESAWLAYWRDEAAVQAVHDRQRTGLTSHLVEGNSTSCYVASCGAFAIVAFRGTRPDKWNDIFTDVNYPTVPWPDQGDGAFVHEGFKQALDAIRVPLERALAALPAACKVWFTGHSLGAALATLAGSRYRASTAGVYTIGSPLVGNQNFAGAFNETFTGGKAQHSFRYVNDHDAVTDVPPELFAFPHGRYTHVEEERWISHDGNVGTTPATLPDFVQDIFGTPLFLLQTIEHALGGGLSVLPAALTDHTPLYYVLNIWNDFAKNFPNDR